MLSSSRAKTPQNSAFQGNLRGEKNNDSSTFRMPRNICRSTMTQFVFQHMVNDQGLKRQILHRSAATSREEIGNPPHYGTVNKLRQEGIPVLKHRAIQMTNKITKNTIILSVWMHGI